MISPLPGGECRDLDTEAVECIEEIAEFSTSNLQFLDILYDLIASTTCSLQKRSGLKL